MFLPFERSWAGLADRSGAGVRRSRALRRLVGLGAVGGLGADSEVKDLGHRELPLRVEERMDRRSRVGLIVGGARGRPACFPLIR